MKKIIILLLILCFPIFIIKNKDVLASKYGKLPRPSISFIKKSNYPLPTPTITGTNFL